MHVYAGIDEAGYGPMFGPLLVGRTVFAVRDPQPGPGPHAESPAEASSGERPGASPEELPQAEKLPGAGALPGAGVALWERLSQAVCRQVGDRRGRIAVNDSKKLTQGVSRIKHLEIGCLAFAALAGHQPASLDQWLTCLGARCQEDLAELPWYEPTPQQPWEALPAANTPGQVAVARSLLRSAAAKAGVELIDLGAAVVLENRFNRMVAATRSKAAASFTFVAQHIRHVWDRLGQHAPLVAVDRQSGRMRYRELLSLTVPEAQVRVLEEAPARSGYHLEVGGRAMTVWFEVDADKSHLPVALASMVSKYTRELFMMRFNAYFQRCVPTIAPTAGYAQDAKRFWRQLQPHLDRLGIRQELLCRQA